MAKNPDSPKKKSRKEKKRVVKFSESKEELVVEIDGKWVRYFNADAVLKLIEKAKEGRPEESDVQIIVTCNACGKENGEHTEECPNKDKKELVN